MVVSSEEIAESVAEEREIGVGVPERIEGFPMHVFGHMLHLVPELCYLWAVRPTFIEVHPVDPRDLEDAVREAAGVMVGQC